jgi:hypothetical protein
MATSAGFKQQCPSCEAWVPVRDTNLIGRKIDCPKCKYRFVVEDPGEEVEAEEEEEERPAKASKKPRRGEDEEEEEAPRRQTSKAKAGPRRGEDEEEEEEKEKKAGGVPTKMLLGVGLGVVALGLLGAVGYFIFGGSDKPAPPRASAPTNTSAPTPPQQQQPAAETKAAAPSSVSLEAVTSLLPGEVQGLCTVRMSDLPATGLGRTIFSRGALDQHIFTERLGLVLDDIDLILQGWNFTDNWSFNVVHSAKPIDQAAVKAALHLTPAPKKILEKEYFLAGPNPWLDELGRLTFALLVQVDPREVPPATRPLAVCFHDAKTLIIANQNQVEQFLKAKGVFPKLSQPGAAPASGATKAAAPASGGNLMGGGKSASNPRGGTPAKKEESAAPAGPSALYLTVPPKLKKMMDRVDVKRPTLSLAMDMQAAAAGHVPPLGLDTLDLRQNLLKDGELIGMGLNVKDQLSFLIAVDFPAEEIATERMEAYRKEVGLALAKKLGLEFKVKVDVVGAETKPDTPAPVITPNPNQNPRGPGRASPAAAGGGGGRQQAPPAQMGAGGRDPSAPKDDKESKVSQVDARVVEKTVVVLEVKLVEQAANFAWITGRLRQLVLQQKGHLDMANRRLRIFDLAKAMHTYLDKHQGEFPRGALERTIPNSRASRPYPPEQRLSWMVELLPDLGSDAAALNARIDRTKSWRDPPDNLPVAATLIPPFLNVQNPENTWWIRYPGMNAEVAATNYVGIAGVGLDAADYRPDEPSTTTKLGVFGYERTTKTSEISDGAANTIAIIQVPPTFKRAWMAGGGSTVAGVPEKNSIRPFVSCTYKGKRGTMAIMADCTVRFISETISDEAFQALCTIKGGESVIIDRDAPKVPPPEESTDLQVETIASAPPPQAPRVPSQPTSPVQGDWKEYVSTDAGFSVLMPGTPTEQTLSAPGPQGTVNTRVWLLENAGARYVVTLIQSPTPMDLKAIEKDSTSFKAGFEASSHCKILSEKKMPFAGGLGFEFELQMANLGRVKSRVYLQKQNAFSLVVGPPGAVSTDSMNRFFDSFKLIR